MVPLAVGYLGWLSAAGQASAWSQGPGHGALLATTGIVTALPLLCFAGAANRISLTTLGLLQYIAPTLQFILGVTFFGEAMSPVRWVGFSLVWLALMILTVESITVARRRAVHRRFQSSVESVEAGATLDPAPPASTPTGSTPHGPARLQAP